MEHASALILTNAHCVEFSSRTATRCTLLIENGFIARRESRDHHQPKGIQVHDLEGRYIMPGFIDSHTHLVAEGIKMQRVDLRRCRSLDECLQKIAASLKADEIVFAVNWDESSWRSGDATSLNRRALDRISKSRPIVLRRVCGHYAVANTAALRLIPGRWKIVDREKGALYEDVALNLSDIFAPDDEMLVKAVRLATAKALRLGITSVHEISNPRYFRVLQKERSRLRMRFSIYLTEKYHDHAVRTGLFHGFGDEWIRFAGTKVFVDGSLGARTAALKKPYVNGRNCGRILVPMSKLRGLVRSAEDNGMQLMIHSIGDRSTEAILRVLKSHIAEHNPLRHRIEHAELLGDESVSDIMASGIVVSMQPNFVRNWQKPGGLYENLIGDRFRKMNRFRALLDRGVKVVFGSDCMPLGPLYGLQGAIAHPFEDGRLSAAKAFQLYTEAGAYAAGEEKTKGKLLPGYLADIVVLNRNPLDVKNLPELKVEAVMVGGVFRHARGGFAALTQ